MSLLHGLEAFFEFAVVEAMGDDRRYVQTALEHDGHLVPSLIHFPAVDTLDVEHVEDHDVPVDSDGFRWDPEHGDLTAVAHRIEHRAERGR